MTNKAQLDRRSLIAQTLGTLGILSIGPNLLGMSSSMPFIEGAGLQNLGPLANANTLGARVPLGYSIRIVAESGKNVLLANGKRSKYVWHGAPDGGACFALSDGGWIYVSNCEIDKRGGGAGALQFDKDGLILDAYPILQGTNQNCAGGPTPWGTWLSCEEVSNGAVYECDPTGATPAKIRRALGLFRHEAVAVDPVLGHIYLTEDESDGCFYRYTPASIAFDGRMDMDQGLLELAVLAADNSVTWMAVPNPTPSGFQKQTRKQLKEAKRFDGGEGIWYHQGLIYFTSKGDNRVWTYDTNSQKLGILYDKASSKNGILSGVDNVTVSPEGNILIAEDGGDMQIVVLSPSGEMQPLVQLEGQSLSEITGPAITPTFDRLYFSSQRGPKLFGTGVTYEMRGRFT